VQRGVSIASLAMLVDVEHVQAGRAGSDGAVGIRYADFVIIRS